MTTGLLQAAVLLSMAACGGAPTDDAQAEPRLAEVEEIRSVDQIVLPMDSYVLSGKERLLLVDAQHELTRRCLARFGVDYTEPAQPASAYLSLNNERRFGVFDAAVAKQYGFHPPPEDDAAQYAVLDAWRPDASEATLLRGPGAAGQVDSQGDPVPAGGCYGEASRAVTIDPEAGVNEPTAEIHDLYLTAIDDSRTRAAFEDWSACMRDASLDYPDPPTLFETTWDGPVTAEERRVATTHVSCAVETNMVGRWVSVLAAYQEREIATQADYFDRLRQANADLVASAREVVAAVPGRDG